MRTPGMKRVSSASVHAPYGDAVKSPHHRITALLHHNATAHFSLFPRSK
jgi:hypothetical protein